MRDHFPGLIHLGDAVQFIDLFANITDRKQLFEDFEYGEVSRLARHMVCYRAAAGTLLIEEGDEGDFGLLVLSGRVGVVKRNAAGQSKRIGEVGPGGTIGEMSMIDGQPRAATCIADDATEFALLDREGLTAILADDPRLGVKILIELLQHLSSKLRVASTRLAEELAV